MIAQNFLNRRVSLNLKDLYPDSIIMVLKENGEAYKFNTNGVKRRSYALRCLHLNDSVYKLNDGMYKIEREITEEKPIAKLMSYYKNIKNVYLLRAL